MTDKEKSRILNLFTEYEGTTYEDENRITIEANNLIGNNVRSKRNLCTVRIVNYNRRELFQWSVEAEERGLEIIGGCALPCEDLGEAISRAKRELVRYNFSLNEQISLF